MTKYLRIFIHFIYNNFVREMEYRTNFIIQLVMQAFFVYLQIFTINIFFQYTTSIHGWTKEQMLLLIGLFRIVQGAFHIFVHTNLLDLPENISRGELDFNLTKPVDSLFITSFRRHQLHEVTTYLSGWIIILYAVINLQDFNLLSWIKIIIFSISGFISLYSIIALFSILSFFTTRLTALSSLWDVISKTSRFPLNVLTSDNPIANSLLGPLFLVVILPSQLILNKVPLIYFPIELFGSVTLLYLTRLFWSLALRHYSSASS